MIAASGATSLVANGTIAKRIVAILQLNDMEFLQIRCEPLENIEILVWELAGQQMFASRNIHARIDRNTINWDPHMSSATFFILGLNRDMNLEVRNPMGYPISQARVIFWGHRYILQPIDLNGLSSNQKNELYAGNPKTVKDIIGPVTWVPAEGRQS
jgi:hypothetical protein